VNNATNVTRLSVRERDCKGEALTFESKDHQELSQTALHSDDSPPGYTEKQREE